MSGQRVAESLNAALFKALADDPRRYLIGEDLSDPYGGAFKVTRGLSTRFPGQVLSTPISEAAIVGLANGLALAGSSAIVEIMFADFATLAFDQLVNFAAKSVTMYGRRHPLHLLVRCPTGGGRGYGPTHSQSLQKHFVGVPHLTVAEVSPLHDNAALIRGLLDSGEPCLLFEDKVSYGVPLCRDGVVDDLFRFDYLDAEHRVARAHLGDLDRCDCLIVVPGGLTYRAVDAAWRLFLEREISCQIVVPFQLHPFDPAILESTVDKAGQVVVAEDGTPGATWADGIARQLYEQHWNRLRRPIRVLTARDTVIPTAAHLEQDALIRATTIHDAILVALGA
jgi:pyruvate/2-oxoglutarate/acetoin dehydrogenase E1 component